MSSVWVDGEFAYREAHDGLPEYVPATEYWAVRYQRDDLLSACEAIYEAYLESQSMDAVDAANWLTAVIPAWLPSVIAKAKGNEHAE